ncbi:hypothetical protein C8J56DRAFT_153892 [Mycena floridula]|nr:hypothetical protein C8J56DRAFT_153892 [Mycena floridula]
MPKITAAKKSELRRLARCQIQALAKMSYNDLEPVPKLTTRQREGIKATLKTEIIIRLLLAKYPTGVDLCSLGLSSINDNSYRKKESCTIFIPARSSQKHRHHTMVARMVLSNVSSSPIYPRSILRNHLLVQPSLSLKFSAVLAINVHKSSTNRCPRSTSKDSHCDTLGHSAQAGSSQMAQSHSFVCSTGATKHYAGGRDCANGIGERCSSSLSRP